MAKFCAWKFGAWKFDALKFGAWKFSAWKFGTWQFDAWKFSDWKFKALKFGAWKFSAFPFLPSRCLEIDSALGKFDISHPTRFPTPLIKHFFGGDIGYINIYTNGVRLSNIVITFDEQVWVGVFVMIIRYQNLGSTLAGHFARHTGLQCKRVRCMRQTCPVHETNV